MAFIGGLCRNLPQLQQYSINHKNDDCYFYHLHPDHGNHVAADHNDSPVYYKYHDNCNNTDYDNNSNNDDNHPNTSTFYHHNYHYNYHHDNNYYCTTL
ncbi:hypothetical protein RB195_010850 [Necator americanus]|uniref:Uncharacterized protein n=1 Tax=Necator americanus TaxID=51031 RepID=A0ABR1D0J6_NECAM